MNNQNNENKTLDTVSVEYQGAIVLITKEEFEALREGWLTFKDLGLA